MSQLIRERRASIGAVAIFLLVLGILIPTTTAYADGTTLYNWFGSNFTFDTTLRGQTRYYDLDNIGCDFHAYTDSGTGVGNNTTFSISLNRDNGWLGSTGCGEKTAPRNGDSHFDWYGVGSGNYFFYFSKAFDGQTVKCDAMGMYSW